MFELIRRQLPCLVALCGLLGVVPAWAATAVSATRIALPGVTLQNVQAEFGPGAQPDTLAVHVHADQAELPALGWHKINLELHGQLRRDAQLRWQFSGTTQLGGAPGGALSNAVLTLVIDQAANTLTVNLDQAATHLAGALPLDQPSHAQINLRHLPAAWLQGLLATVWSGHSVGGGTFDADLALDLRSRGIQSSGDVSATALSVAGNSSALGTQNLTTRARFGLDTVSQPARLTLTGNARDGSVDIGPVQAHLPSHDVLFDLAAAIDSDGIQLDRVHVVDPDALALDGAFAFDAKGVVKLARADRFQAQFPAAYDRYGQPWLDGWLAPNLHPNGQLTGRFDYGGGGGWHSFALHTGGLDLSDDSGLLQANGLHGDLVWSSQGEQQPTIFAWNSLTFRQFVISAAQAHWRSRNGALSMQEPINVGFLKGQLHLTTLALRPAAAKAERIDLAASLSGVDLPSFDQAVGWNPLAGSVDATLTGLQIDGDHYQLGGQFTFKTLGGTATIKRVWARHPFAVAPLFGADVSLHQLDLASLSDSYNFGSLSGRLDGTVDNLVLLNGSPDSFEFNLLAPDGGHISLRAANNLASLAGSGPAGGLQTAMMKVFKNANYKRIGLHGKLEHGVLQLGGLDGDHSGYTIVEGSGLPYMHVTGDQNRVDWSLFLKRLRATEQASADH